MTPPPLNLIYITLYRASSIVWFWHEGEPGDTLMNALGLVWQQKFCEELPPLPQPLTVDNCLLYELPQERYIFVTPQRPPFVELRVGKDFK